MKYVNNAQFITRRPPRDFRRLIENAAAAAMTSVMIPTVMAMNSELPSWRQKWIRK
jgi:hypothetical protein